jgi:hypothetical protein
MKQDLNPLRTGLLQINTFIMPFMIFMGLTIRDYLFSIGPRDLSTLVISVVFGIGVFSVFLFLALRKIIQGKSQIKTMGKRKYWAFTTNVAAFLILGLSFWFWFSDAFFLSVGIFLFIEFFLCLFYYNDIAPIKDTQTPILDGPA